MGLDFNDILSETNLAASAESAESEFEAVEVKFVYLMTMQRDYGVWVNSHRNLTTFYPRNLTVRRPEKLKRFQKDNDIISFYTGFPDYYSLMVCFEFVATKAQNISYGKYDRKLFKSSPCQFPGAAAGNCLC